MAANFGKIRTLAEERGMTLSELAERVSMTPNGLGILIKNNRAMSENLVSIAKELGVPVGIFFDDYEETPTSTTPIHSDLHAVIAQKNEIIAQKDKIIEQKDELIRILVANRK